MSGLTEHLYVLLKPLDSVKTVLRSDVCVFVVSVMRLWVFTPTAPVRLCSSVYVFWCLYV